MVEHAAIGYDMGEKTGTRKQKGTVIGLSIVKKIVSMHGGNIHFQSVKEKGTNFVITLPQTL